jgi:hypothetical protein
MIIIEYRKNKNSAGAPKRERKNKMLTYGVYENGKINRAEQTNKTLIQAYNRVEKVLNALDDERADSLIEAIGNGVWGERNANETALIKSYGLTIKDAEVWYCHDED